MALRNIRRKETITGNRAATCRKDIQPTRRFPNHSGTLKARFAELPMTRCDLISFLATCSVLLSAGIALPDETAPSNPETRASVEITSEQLHEAISGLGSAEYSVRQRSMELLKNVTAEQIPVLGKAILNHPNNEVAQRCIELLEQNYTTGDRDSGLTRRSSDALELAAKSDRWFVAEATREILERHWKRRVEIACVELQAMGVPMSPKEPSRLWIPDHYDGGPFGRRNPISDRSLKIYADEYWKSTPEHFVLLRRLSPLVSHNIGVVGSQVAVYLLDGHPLRQEEVAELKTIFGDTLVQERGRVCLGISHWPQDAGRTGVMVSGVAQDSSADKANIRENDTLLQFDGKPLKDFDQLIESLKAFRPGDEVTFLIQRFGGQPSIEVKVKLQGWYER